jgi:hypothetical protein
MALLLLLLLLCHAGIRLHDTCSQPPIRQTSPWVSAGKEHIHSISSDSCWQLAETTAVGTPSASGQIPRTQQAQACADQLCKGKLYILSEQEQPAGLCCACTPGLVLSGIDWTHVVHVAGLKRVFQAGIT